MANIETAISDGHDFLDLITILIENHTFKNISKVLDVGAGEGTIIFKYLGKKYWAIEKNKELKSSLNQKLNSIKGEHRVLFNDILEIELKEKFDLIILNNLITEIHINDIDKCLRKCLNLLSQNGILFLRANSNFHSDIQKVRDEKEFVVKELAKNKFYIESNGYVKNYFEEQELVDLLEKHDLTVQLIKRIDERFSRTNILNKPSEL